MSKDDIQTIMNWNHHTKESQSLSACRGLGPADNKAPRSRSLTPPPGGMGRRKYNKRLMSRDKDREGSLTNYGHRQKPESTWGEKKKSNLLPIKSE